MYKNSYTIGTCTELCSEDEIKLRKTKNLVHYFERKHGMLIKEFTRSAADRKMEKPGNLRTFDALRNTLEFLFDM